METLIDELATRANTDQIAYRAKLLNPDTRRLRAALALRPQKAAGRNSVPRHHAVGIACTEYQGKNI
jgi:hypothetical protein